MHTRMFNNRLDVTLDCTVKLTVRIQTPKTQKKSETLMSKGHTEPFFFPLK